MGKLGLIPLIYGILCFIFNFVGLLFSGVPNLGEFGSWLFNPLGKAFSAPLADLVVSNAGLDFWLIGDGFKSGAAWFIGGVFAIIWTFGLIWVGVKLLGRRGKSRALRPVS